MKLALVIALLGFGTLATADDPADEGPKKEGRPNVIYLLADDRGWADIGLSNDAVYSPNLDRLAAEGVTFEQFYVMPQCSPTRIRELSRNCMRCLPPTPAHRRSITRGDGDGIAKSNRDA